MIDQWLDRAMLVQTVNNQKTSAPSYKSLVLELIRAAEAANRLS